MGSSYRSDLKSGGNKEWQEKLERAVQDVHSVIHDIYDACDESNQFDDAADDGALAQKLSIAVELIESELPNKRTRAHDDLDHWCSYNGIVDGNKGELLSIIKSLGGHLA